MAFIFKLLVSALLIGWIIRGLDLEALKTSLQQAEPALFIGAYAALTSLALIQAARWQWVLAALGGRHPYPNALANVLIGQFFNQTLPSTIGGDAVRVWLLRTGGMPLGRALDSVIIDRLIALAALMCMGIAGLPWLFKLDADDVGAWTVAAASAAGILALTSILVLDKVPWVLKRWRPVQAAAALSTHARRVTFGSRAGIIAFTTSVLIHSCLSMVVFTIAIALGVDIEAWQCLVLVPPVMVASAIPISVAGWGVRESTMVAAFALIGMPQEMAFAISVLFGLGVIGAGLPGGVIWLAARARTTATMNAVADSRG